jgi:hypothetical protein
MRMPTKIQLTQESTKEEPLVAEVARGRVNSNSDLTSMRTKTKRPEAEAEADTSDTPSTLKESTLTTSERKT